MIQKEMVALGLSLVSKTTISSEETPFTEDGIAKSENWCFHQYGKNLFFNIECLEIQNEDCMTLWTITQIVQSNFEPHISDIDSFFVADHVCITPKDHFPIWYVKFQEDLNKEVFQTPKTILAIIDQLIKVAKPTGGKMPQMNARWLWPSDSFPEGELAFWNKFDLRYLKSFVKYIHGIEYKELTRKIFA